MSYPTSRKFPRSMAEAFPKDYAAAIEHHRAHRVGTWAHALACIVACIVIGLLIVSGL